MYQIGDKVWAVIHSFDLPKECEIIDIRTTFSQGSGLIPEYIVRYKSREFSIRNVDVYPTQQDAEIYWAILIQQDYAQTLEYPDLFECTDDYELANIRATKILSKYADEIPHILLKYL